MKCQNLFSGKSKKNITNLSSAELAKRVVKVNYLLICLRTAGCLAISVEPDISNTIEFSI